MSCRSNKRLGWEAEAAERSDKWLLKEEVAEGRGASVNRPLSEEVAEKSLARPFIHPSLHPLVH